MLELALHRGEIERHDVAAGGGLDLGQRAHLLQQAGEAFGLRGLEEVVARALVVDPGDHHAGGLEAQRPAPVGGLVERRRADQGDDEEGDEELEQQESGRALAVPGQAEQVADHRGPPASAVLGASRDMR